MLMSIMLLLSSVAYADDSVVQSEVKVQKSSVTINSTIPSRDEKKDSVDEFSIAILNYLELYKRALSEGSVINNDTLLTLTNPTNPCNFSNLEDKCTNEDSVWSLILNRNLVIISK